MQGVVSEFDCHVGLGVVRSSGDARSYRFHCTQIADGTRSVAVGAVVEFDVIPGVLGDWEAANVTKAGP